jgi:pimeloyl-ACP methyl ester carboxylesterase
MPFVTMRDLRMYYEIRGAGPRLLSISGTGGDLHRSPNVYEMPIAQHFQILAYDQRGLGKTIGAGLHGVIEPNPELRTVTKQALKERQIRRGR